MLKSIAFLVVGIAIGVAIAFFASPDPKDANAKDGQDSRKEKSSASGGSSDPGSRTRSGGSSRTSGDGPGASTGTRSKAEISEVKARREEFASMMTKVFSGEATEEEQLAFWERARTSNELERIMSELQETAEAEPENIDVRMNLAETYVAKLLGVPAGPEKGLWAGKAEALWREVIEVDPEHWEASYSLASTLSRYPAFLNKTGEAIQEFERVIEVQQSAQEPGERFADSYVQLARLHRTNGNPAAALEVLEQGADQHPDDANITEGIATLRSSFTFEDEGTGAPPE